MAGYVPDPNHIPNPLPTGMGR